MKQIVCEYCKDIKSLTQAVSCEDCKFPELFINRIDFSKCPICGCQNLYRKKDFNQVIGCLIIFIGAILVPWTYGLSLIILSLVDFLLYKRVKNSVECYKCKSEFKGFSVPEDIQQFDHHTAELYENPN